MLKKIKNKILSHFGKKTAVEEKQQSVPKGPQAKTRGPKKRRSKRPDKRSPDKRSPGKRSPGKHSKRIKDPDAKSEARRYQNPVASRTLILETISKNGMMTQSSIFEELQVKPDQEEGVSRRLGAMVRDGQLIQNRRGGYLPVDEKHLIRGHVIAHADGYGFLVPDEGGDDLFLNAKQMRGVLHGDRAVATVAGVDRRGRLEGSVVNVIERANTTLISR